MFHKYTFVSKKYELNVNQVYRSAQAAIAKYHKVRGLNNGYLLSYSSRGCEVQDQNTVQFGFWWELSSWPIDDGLLTVSSHLRRREKALSPSLLRRQLSYHIGPYHYDLI